jgi:REP element-mobilizing transposase RayT
MKQKGWHSRGYLPHYDGQIAQFVTIHLGDSLPQPVLLRLKEEVERGVYEKGSREARIRMEQYLDSGIGECVLRNEDVAKIVEIALFYYAKTRYRLVAWVIMPNHVHLLLIPIEGVSLSDIMKDFKGYTARAINKLLGRSGHVWHPDYFDRYIRGEDHFHKTIRYIENNPVKAGLVDKPEQWRYSSAWHKHQGNADILVREP